MAKVHDDAGELVEPGVNVLEAVVHVVSELGVLGTSLHETFACLRTELGDVGSTAAV
jgi:hypothetical protein